MKKQRLLLTIAAFTFLTMSAITSQARPIVAESEQDRQIQPFKWNDPQWYKLKLAKGLLYVARLAETLQRRNLYATGEDLVQDIQCDASTKTARTADGSCNDPKLPRMGAAGTYFSRSMPVAVSRSQGEDALDPDARSLSIELMTRRTFQPAKLSNFFTAAYFQFVIHDWFAHDRRDDELKSLRLAESDPLYVKYGQRVMAYPASPADETRPDGVALYRNKVTHWFDASQVYGSDLATQNKLRAFRDGLLRMDGDHLPLDENGQEMAGNTNNWWIGLSVVHTLFAKEHNSIARELKHRNPAWSDQRLFDKARLINTALIAKLFLTELGEPRFQNKIVTAQLWANWYGLVNMLTTLKKHGYETPFEPGWEKLLLGSTKLGGFVGSRQNLKGVPFAMTEEWSQIYRYHSLLPDAIELGATSIPLEQTRGTDSIGLVRELGHDRLLLAFGNQYAGSVTINNTPRFLQELEMPLVGRVDIAALDIIRERERGIPRYNQMRRYVGLPAFVSFSELTSDQELAAKLSRLYHGDIERLDTTVGLLVEPRPEGFELGETHIRVLGILALRRLQADRFFTTDFTPRIYTKMGIDHINKTTLKDVLLRHYPSLAPELENVSNPFVSWSSEFQKRN